MEEVKEEVKEEKKEPDILEVAKKRTEELDKANKELEEQIKRHDKLIAESIVRGKSFGGQKEKTEQELIEEEAERYANSLNRSFKNN